jgi:pimeloyl-ACP methyl ester carboxylesterase
MAMLRRHSKISKTVTTPPGQSVLTTGAKHTGTWHRRRLPLAVVAAMCIALGGCGSQPGAPESDRTPVLNNVHPCAAPAVSTSVVGPGPGDPGSVTFSCATLTVPLDHAGLHPSATTAGQLLLQVAMADNRNAPRGVLVFLTGGPGEPGVSFVERVAHELDPAVFRDYRLVFIDQRGTGSGALQCPQLQQVMGSSDLTVPPVNAVQECAQAIGDARQFFTTADTVADLEALRQALGASKLSFDGVSYGTFVAERYAVTYPDRVSRLVLDSVVPHDSVGPLELAAITRTADVLRMACQENACNSDPAQDLSEVIAARHDGPRLLDTLTGLTVGHPRLTSVPAALHEAVRGNSTKLDAIITAEHQNQAVSAAELSQGLHASTLCEDLRGPWGNAATPVADRAAATEKAVEALPDAAVFPYDRATAAGNGIAVTCQVWPATPVVSFPPGGDLPPVPVLLLAGDHDLSTPLAWAQQEATRAHQGHLVIIPGSGHGTQHLTNGPMGRAAVTAFLTGH